MNAITANYCASLVEKIRVLVRHRPRPDDWDEQVGELCDQLIMRLQPIEVVRPK